MSLKECGTSTYLIVQEVLKPKQSMFSKLISLKIVINSFLKFELKIIKYLNLVKFDCVLKNSVC